LRDNDAPADRAPVKVAVARLQVLARFLELLPGNRALASVAIFIAVCSLPSFAQSSSSVLPRDLVLESALPDAPTPQEGPSSISGTISATNGTTIANAQLILVGPDGRDKRVLTSGDNGEFTFRYLPGGTYSLTVTAAGLDSFQQPEIVVKANEKLQLSPIVLAVAGTTTEVRVTVTQVEIAQEQVHEEEQQRVLGVLPNFYSSYIWDAAPLTAKQKFSLALHSIADPVALLGTGFIAGIEQAQDTFPGYGQGAAGYGRRFGAAYGDDAIGRILASAALPVLFRQDPRYFYKGVGSKKERVLYAITRTVVTRGDNGKTQPNYSHILGTLAAGGISNFYHPDGNRGIGLTFRNEALDTAGNAANNLIREFISRRATPKVPDYKQGQKSVTKPATP
jgi:hypothetical protein